MTEHGSISSKLIAKNHGITLHTVTSGGQIPHLGPKLAGYRYLGPKLAGYRFLVPKLAG